MSVKIAGYLRISVDTEVDRDSTSIENQRKIIQKSCFKFGQITIVSVPFGFHSPCVAFHIGV